MASKRPNNHGDSGADAPRVSAGGWSNKRSKPRRQTFAGPAGCDEVLRLNFTRDAYADLVAHAKSQLDAEICGVLLGSNCVDDEGEHVLVDGIIRGVAARQGGTHVTFTQETWTRIHETLERDHPDRDIVGWYHTHPGFGVEFSEMDLFIQRNFFAGSNQVAFVTDPLGGEEAICVNDAGGIRHLGRFWVDGRERRCRRPSDQAIVDPEAPGRLGDVLAALRNLEDRLVQTTRLVDEQRAAQYHLLATLGFICALAFVGLIGYTVYRQVYRDINPPERLRYADIPVQVGDETYLVGVDVVRWRMPEAMSARFIQAVQQMLAAEEEAKRKAAEQAASEAKEAAGEKPDPTPADASPSPNRQGQP